MSLDRNILLTIIFLSFAGCSNSPIEVVSYTWDCEQMNDARECLVIYTIKNNDEFVQEATVKIRAHRRRRINESVSNKVVGENTIIVKLAPKEQKILRHKMIIKRKPTQIVVSAYIAK